MCEREKQINADPTISFCPIPFEISLFSSYLSKLFGQIGSLRLSFLYRSKTYCLGQVGTVQTPLHKGQNFAQKYACQPILFFAKLTPVC